MSDAPERAELRQALAENLGDAPWAMLEAHAKRGGLIFVSPDLDLLDVAVAIAKDRSEEVGTWMHQGLLKRPSSEELSLYGSEPQREWTFVIVQPFVLVSRP